jgi:hypothetical protein
MKSKTWAPRLEALEDRLTPSLSYSLNHGTLSVTGSTASTTVTVTSTGNSVTVNDGGATQTFTVTHDLLFNIQMTAATPTFNYDPGAAAPGNVRLKVLSNAALTLNVAGKTDVDINGRLSVTTGAGNDTVSIDDVNPDSLKINTGAGQDTVLIGFNSPVTVRGNLTARKVNLIGLGVLNGPAVTVNGDVSISTDVTAGITFQEPNNVDIENHTTIKGDLSANLNGAFELFSTMGVVKGNADVDFSVGSDEALFQDGSSVGGDTYVNAVGKASTTISVGLATFGGNLDVDLGNGDNVFVFHGTLKGRSLSYEGGNGADSVTIAKEASLTKANLSVDLGSGTNSFTLNSNLIRKAEIEAQGTGTTLNLNVPITFPLDIDINQHHHHDD